MTSHNRFCLITDSNTKKVQNILVDPKSQELLELLKKERMHGTLTTQDQINSRQNAERILGPDENLFRIDWVRLPDHTFIYHG